MHPDVWTLVQHTTQTVRRLAVEGGVVLIGRAAHVIAADLPHSVHIRLIAPRNIRVDHVRSWMKLTHREACVYVDRTDKARRRFLLRYFNIEPEDPKQYHLVINTGIINPDLAGRLIGQLVDGLRLCPGNE